ncbi:MAG: hypothetical protein ACJA0Y_000606 [Maricaulis maris]|jgi:hypothetical protein|nr:hypothetical protein [Maricaulis sp.]
MEENELERIRELANAAAAGPWAASIEGRDHVSGSNIIMTQTTDKGLGRDFDILGATPADMDFIASARQDIVTLLDEVQRLQRIVETRNNRDRHN